MKFPTDHPVKVVMLGAGGTGGYVAPYLFRLLHMLDRPVRFIICDGDIVERKNLDRQNFVEADLGENKARVLSERYSAVLGMKTEYVPNFIEMGSQSLWLCSSRENGNRKIILERRSMKWCFCWDVWTITAHASYATMPSSRVMTLSTSTAATEAIPVR